MQLHKQNRQASTPFPPKNKRAREGRGGEERGGKERGQNLHTLFNSPAHTTHHTVHELVGTSLGCVYIDFKKEETILYQRNGTAAYLRRTYHACALKKRHQHRVFLLVAYTRVLVSS